MSYEAKTDCFAYRKMYGCETCIALTSLYCKQDSKCAFYKSIKDIKRAELRKENKNDKY